MTQIPTADEIARIIVAAFRMVGADPLRVAIQIPQGKPPEYVQRIVRGRTYAALVIRKLFPAVPISRVSRMVGARPEWAPDMLRDHYRGKLRWYDETDFRAILVNCGVEPREAVQEVVDETEDHAEPPASPAPPPPAPVLTMAAPVTSFRFGSKRRLEEELRQAVINTAKMQPQGEEL